MSNFNEEYKIAEKKCTRKKIAIIPLVRLLRYTNVVKKKEVQDWYRICLKTKKLYLQYRHKGYDPEILIFSGIEFEGDLGNKFSELAFLISIFKELFRKEKIDEGSIISCYKGQKIVSKFVEAKRYINDSKRYGRYKKIFVITSFLHALKIELAMVDDFIMTKQPRYSLEVVWGVV